MITLISGTNRPGSNTLKVTAVVASLYTELGVPTKLVDLRDLPPAIFLPSAYAAPPETFLPFSRSILDATGLVVVTPEYNGSMPGVLKLFIDHLKFPQSFEAKPVCFIGLAAGMWGALRSVEQLQAIFGYRNAHIFPKRVFLPGISQALDAEGRFVDGGTTDRLREQAAGFAAFVKALE